MITYLLFVHNLNEFILFLTKILMHHRKTDKLI